MPKVSVIVPVYNTEEYLSQCLDSILNQSLKDIEVLCVDDGSTDSSLQILNEYAKKDSRVKVFTKPNAGYGHSMNLGLDNATGEYIGLVDSDDMIACDMYECLYQYATNHDLDFVRSDHYRWYPKASERSLIYCYATSALYRTVIHPLQSADERVLFTRVVTCTGLYKTSFIRENNIRYHETPGAAFQDQGFWFQTTIAAKRMMFVNKAFYYYRFDNENSSINSNKAVYTMDNEYNLIQEMAEAKDNGENHVKAFYWRARFAMTFFSIQQMGDNLKVSDLEALQITWKEAADKNQIDTSFFTEEQKKELSLLLEDAAKFCAYQVGNYKWNQYMSARSKKPGVLGKLRIHIKSFGFGMTVKKMLGKM